MKKIKGNIFLIINGIYIVITGGFNSFAYFRLPDTIDTQFSFTGGHVNTMPKAIYLIGSVVIVLILAVFGAKKEIEIKIKYTIINTIIVIANIVIILMQLG